MPGSKVQAPRGRGVKGHKEKPRMSLHSACSVWPVQEREMEIRRQALEEERRRREDLEKRLQEETSRRQKLVEREVKLREKQRSQVF